MNMDNVGENRACPTDVNSTGGAEARSKADDEDGREEPFRRVGGCLVTTGGYVRPLK
jgi:hypothetical protein